MKRVRVEPVVSKDFTYKMSMDHINQVFVSKQPTKKSNIPLTDVKIKPTKPRPICSTPKGLRPTPFRRPERMSLARNHLSLLDSVSQSSVGTNSLELTSLSEEDNLGDSIHQLYHEYLEKKMHNLILREDRLEKEKKAAENLVEIKSHYDELLDENLKSKTTLHKLKTLQQGIADLDRKLESSQKLVQFLQDIGYNKLMKAIAKNLNSRSNELVLVDLSVKSLKEAFETDDLGFDSVLFARLVRLNEFISDHSEEVSDTAQVMSEVKSLLERKKDISERYKKCLDEATNSTINNLYSMAVKDLQGARETLNLGSARDNQVGEPRAESTPLTK